MHDEFVDDDGADENDGANYGRADSTHIDGPRGGFADVIPTFPKECWPTWPLLGSTKKSKDPVSYDCRIPSTRDQANNALPNDS